jgi:hypothetical protein
MRAFVLVRIRVGEIVPVLRQLRTVAGVVEARATFGLESESPRKAAQAARGATGPSIRARGAVRGSVLISCDSRAPMHPRRAAVSHARRSFSVVEARSR